MRKKLYISIFVTLCIGVIGAGIIWRLSKMKIVQEAVEGCIWKDETERVTAHIFLILYNGTSKEKIVGFNIEGGDEYKRGYLEKEKYEISDLQITEGIGQVNREEYSLIIPANQEIMISITAENNYIGDEYKEEKVCLRREPPKLEILDIK